MERLGGFALPNNIPFSFEGQPPESLPFATDNPATPIPYGRNTINVPELDNRMIESSQSAVVGGSILVRLNGDRPVDGRSYPCMTFQEFLMKFYRGEFVQKNFQTGYYFREADIEPSQSVYTTGSITTLLRREGISFANAPINPNRPSLINVAIGRVARVHRIFGQVHTGDRVYFMSLGLMGGIFLTDTDFQRMASGNERDEDPFTKGSMEARAVAMQDLFVSIYKASHRNLTPEQLSKVTAEIAMEDMMGTMSPKTPELLYIGMAMEDSFNGSRDNRTTLAELFADRSKYTWPEYYTASHQTMSKINSEIEKLPMVLMYLD